MKTCGNETCARMSAALCPADRIRSVLDTAALLVVSVRALPVRITVPEA